MTYYTWLKKKGLNYNTLTKRQRMNQRKKFNHISKTPKTEGVRRLKYLKRKANEIELKYFAFIRGAKERKLLFNLSIKEFEIIVSKPCIYCGTNESVGIDRKDNKYGYILTNCQPCCSTCNLMRRTLPMNMFIQYIKRILCYYKK